MSCSQETYITTIDESKRGEIMQAGSWDPLFFLIVFLCFLIIFLGYGYFNKLLWFQQDGVTKTDNWFVSFKSRDLASGGWYHRFGRPVLVVMFLNLVAFRTVIYLSIFSPFQLFIFVFVFYIPISVIFGIILFAILWRIHKQPKISEVDHPLEDPFSDADRE